MAKIIGFVVLVRPHPHRKNSPRVCEVNALKGAILMLSQKVSNLNAIEQGKVSDEEFAILKQLSREAAQVTVTPVDTVQHCSPSPQTPEPSPDVCISLENNEGRMDPERGELESPLAGTGFETPGQQCLSNEGTWEKGRTIADGYLLVGMESNQGGDISSPTERVDTRSVRTTANITFLQQDHKPKEKKKGSEENKQFDPGGEGGEQPPPWNAAEIVVFPFPQGSAGPGVPAVCALCSFPVCSVLYSFLFSGDHFSAS